MPSISYAITAHNEHEELDRLLKQLVSNIDFTQDEIVIQLDETATEEVKRVVEYYYSSTPTIAYYFPLNKDFAAFKNKLKNSCNKDYIFFIDADEYLSDELMRDIRDILQYNPEVEMFFVPRINTVQGITQEHIIKWGWNVNPEGHINYPDEQSRIAKNLPHIKWEGKVHERLVGYKNHPGHLPGYNQGYDYHLMHPKTIERQEIQNQLYNNI